MPQLIFSSFINYFYVLGLFFFIFYCNLQSLDSIDETDLVTLLRWKLYYIWTTTFLLALEEHNLRSLKLFSHISKLL